MQFGTEAKLYNDPEKMAASYLAKYYGNQKILGSEKFCPLLRIIY